MKRIVLTCLAAALAASAWAIELSDAQRSAIEDRIRPTGEVCLQGDACAAAAATVASGPRSGEDVYNAACMACHTTGAAGAPKLGDVAGWADRITKGMDALPPGIWCSWSKRPRGIRIGRFCLPASLARVMRPPRPRDARRHPTSE